MATVLVSTGPEPTGHERIVVAFREGDDLFIPLDGGRPANVDILHADRLCIREIEQQDVCISYAVLGHEPVSISDRDRLDGYTHCPISASTELLHLRGVRSPEWHKEPAHG